MLKNKKLGREEDRVNERNMTNVSGSTWNILGTPTPSIIFLLTQKY